MREEHEFFPTGELDWRQADPGITERVLSRDPDTSTLTRIARWEPGLETVGVIRHDYHEEVYLLEGDLADLTLGRTFHAGDFASRRPGMPHGPYRTDAGCVMLEIRTAP
ncbi:cupin domain-containing protein [Lentzea sp. BCCO 10_0798]|uniref:Cupin domain-containing protein n=1 Tax=Lentzea kristufekii TaxID=3095430 RepID=A0ABU4TYQ3_9PSEU|nr:cupin domain-containing protein [Lentzea sp. BCCO 10_0798]MDX8053218.1 cupin domain-containing protein [Lentzea sp. BCCO 10_0798]